MNDAYCPVLCSIISWRHIIATGHSLLSGPPTASLWYRSCIIDLSWSLDLLDPQFLWPNNRPAACISAAACREHGKLGNGRWKEILFIYVLYFLICYARWIASYWFILCHCGCWPEDVAPRPDDWSARWNRHSLSLPPFVGWDVASLWPEVRGSWVVRGVLPFLCLGMFPPCFLFFPGIS